MIKPEFENLVRLSLEEAEYEETSTICKKLQENIFQKVFRGGTIRQKPWKTNVYSPVQSATYF